MTHYISYNSLENPSSPMPPTPSSSSSPSPSSSSSAQSQDTAIPPITPSSVHKKLPSFLSYNCSSLTVYAEGQHFAFKDMNLIRKALKDNCFIALQETRLNANNIEVFKKQFSGIFAGSLAILFPKDPIQIIEVHQNDQRVLCTVFIDHTGTKRGIINLHGPHGNLSRKENFLKKIDTMASGFQDRHDEIVLTILGDFNIHLDSHDTSHSFLLSIMYDYNLVDSYRHALPDVSKHPGFTRRNWVGQKQSASRIDGIFIDKSFIDTIRIHTKLTKTTSDHSALQISLTKENAVNS